MNEIWKCTGPYIIIISIHFADENRIWFCYSLDASRANHTFFLPTSIPVFCFENRFAGTWQNYIRRAPSGRDIKFMRIFGQTKTTYTAVMSCTYTHILCARTRARVCVCMCVRARYILFSLTDFQLLSSRTIRRRLRRSPVTLKTPLKTD